MFLHARRKWEKAIKAILFGFVGVFILSVFFWYGGMGGKGKAPPLIMAKVGKYRITSKEFEGALQSQKNSGLFGAGSSLEEEIFIRQLIFDNLLNEKRLLEEARREGIGASRQEVSAEVNREVDADVEQLKARDKAGFVREMKRAGLDLEGFKKRLAASYDRRAVAEEVKRHKLHAAVTAGAEVSDLQLKESFDEYVAPHIRVRVGQKGKDAARATAQQILDQVKAGTVFDQVKDKVAKGDADVFVVASPTAQKRGAGNLPEEVEKAALALKVAEICSAPIEAQDAFYVVKLARLESKVPPDFEQRKDFYKQQLQDKMKSEAWQKFLQQTEKTVKVEIVDKEMDGYEKRQQGKIDEAITSLTAALEYEHGDTTARARIHYALAQLWEGKGELDKAAEAYDEAINAAGTAPEAELRIGELLNRQGKREPALKRFKEAAGDAGDSYLIHMRLEQAFKDLGEQELAQKERAWLEQNPPKGMGLGE